MKKRITLIVLMVLAVLLIILLPMILIQGHSRIISVQFRGFTSIEDFDKLEQYRMGNSITDNYLSDEGIVHSFVSKVNFNNEEYDVYVYEFESTTDAVNYYSKCESNPTAPNFGFKLRRNILKTGYIAFYNEYLYRIECNNSNDISGFVDWLTKDFSIDLREELDFYMESKLVDIKDKLEP